MEVCKQTSWEHDVTKSEDEINSCGIMHKQEEGSSLYSQLFDSDYVPTEAVGADQDDDDNNKGHMQQQDLMMQVECSMCGHVGLPQYLFKCLSCCCRFQHFYCSKLYPCYRLEAAICNWCLPLQLEITAAEEKDEYGDYICNRNIDSNHVAAPQSHQQVKRIKKHSKAFEYLLQIIAELADHEGCHDQSTRDGDNHQTKFVCEIDNDVGHDQISDICRFNEVGCYLDSWRPGAVKQATGGGDYHDQIITRDEIKSYNLKDVGFVDHDLLLQKKRWANYEEASLQGRATAKRPRAMKIQHASTGSDAGGDGCINGDKAKEQGLILTLQEAAAKMGFGLDYVTSAAAPAINIDDEDDDEQAGASQSKQTTGPPAMTTWVAAEKAAAGKKDHLINSPSRAFSRRYKLLADVLC